MEFRRVLFRSTALACLPIVGANDRRGGVGLVEVGQEIDRVVDPVNADNPVRRADVAREAGLDRLLGHAVAEIIIERPERAAGGAIHGALATLIAKDRREGDIIRKRLLVIERPAGHRSEEHTYELQSIMRTSYAVFCLKKKQIHTPNKTTRHIE